MNQVSHWQRIRSHSHTQTFDLSGFTLVSEFTHIYLDKFVVEINAVFLIEIFFSNNISIDWSITNSIAFVLKNGVKFNAALCLVSSAIKVSEKNRTQIGYLLVLSWSRHLIQIHITQTCKTLSNLVLHAIEVHHRMKVHCNAVTLYEFVYSVGPRLFDVSRLYRLSHHRIH